MEFYHVLERQGPRNTATSTSDHHCWEGPCPERGGARWKCAPFHQQWDAGCVSNSKEGCLERDSGGNPSSGVGLKDKVRAGTESSKSRRTLPMSLILVREFTWMRAQGSDIKLDSIGIMGLLAEVGPSVILERLRNYGTWLRVPAVGRGRVQTCGMARRWSRSRSMNGSI